MAAEDQGGKLTVIDVSKRFCFFGTMLEQARAELVRERNTAFLALLLPFCQD